MYELVFLAFWPAGSADDSSEDMSDADIMSDMPGYSGADGDEDMSESTRAWGSCASAGRHLNVGNILCSASELLCGARGGGQAAAAGCCSSQRMSLHALTFVCMLHALLLSALPVGEGAADSDDPFEEEGEEGDEEDGTRDIAGDDDQAASGEYSTMVLHQQWQSDTRRSSRGGTGLQQY